LLHSIIPHHHHDHLSVEDHKFEHETADNILDYLELLFHLDMGEGHLENFQSTDGNHLDIQFQYDLGPLNLVEIVYCLNADIKSDLSARSFFPSDRIPIPPKKSSLSLRGPPSIS
jgi:hypothetical protein